MHLTERDCHEVFIYEPCGELSMVLVYEGIMSEYEEGVLRDNNTYINNEVFRLATKALAGGNTIYNNDLSGNAKRFWEVMYNSKLTVEHKFYNIKIRRSL